MVNELNGVALIVAAMNKFPEDAELQRWASGTLVNLVVWEFKDAIKEAGGRRALVDAIENHQDESKEHVKGIQKHANSALKALFL